MDVEELQMQLLSYLYQLGVADLITIAKTLGYSDDDGTNTKKRKGLVKLIEQQLDGKLKDLTDENGVKYLEELSANVMEFTPVCPPLESPEQEKKPEGTQLLLEKMKLEYEAVKQKLEKLMAGQSPPATTEPKGKIKEEDGGESKQLYFRPSDFKRELKIMGQIGEPGQKDKLSFVSLVRQIEGALQKGYKPLDVVDAVVRAINPGMRLRSYLESMNDLTLPRLRSILRSHYEAKSATELYQQLSTLVQGSQEGPQSFLIRALDTRQKIMFATKEADAQLKYDPKLVQGMFLHAVDTGLQDEAVRTRLRPFLQTPDIPDEDLIQQMNVIVSEETERKTKLGSNRHKNLKVNEVRAAQGKEESAETEGAVGKKSKDRPKEEHFMAALQAVRSELATLKETVENSRSKVDPQAMVHVSPRNHNQQWHARSRGCTSCQTEEKGETCDHCYICGSGEHWARGCRQRSEGSERPASGNRRGLQPRDRK